MSKEQCLQLLKLLSALETLILCGAQRTPDHIHEWIEIAVTDLEKEIFK